MGSKRDLRRAGHQIMVMHKKGDDGQLAVATTFRFPSGAGYTVQENGSVRRADGSGKQRRRKKISIG